MFERVEGRSKLRFDDRPQGGSIECDIDGDDHVAAPEHHPLEGPGASNERRRPAVFGRRELDSGARSFNEFGVAGEEVDILGLAVRQPQRYERSAATSTKPLTGGDTNSLHALFDAVLPGFTNALLDAVGALFLSDPSSLAFGAYVGGAPAGLA